MLLLAHRTLAGSLQDAIAPSVNGQIDHPFILPHMFFDTFEEGACRQRKKFHLHSVPQGGAEERNVGHHLEHILVEHGCDTGGHAAFASLDRAARDQRGSSGSYQVGVARWCSLGKRLGIY